MNLLLIFLLYEFLVEFEGDHELNIYVYRKVRKRSIEVGELSFSVVFIYSIDKFLKY